MRSGKFHHGNLRATLLALAENLLNGCEPEDLSLRDLAARAGVSCGAPYRHFKTKDDLLQTLALSGTERLRKSYRRAEAMNVTCEARLREACRAYLQLSEKSPGLYRLIFIHNMLPVPPPPEALGKDAAFATFERLVGEVRGISEGKERRRAALIAWSTLHGFVMLRMQGSAGAFEKEGDFSEALLDAICSPKSLKRRSASLTRR